MGLRLKADGPWALNHRNELPDKGFLARCVSCSEGARRAFGYLVRASAKDKVCAFRDCVSSSRQHDGLLKEKRMKNVEGKGKLCAHFGFGTTVCMAVFSALLMSIPTSHRTYYSAYCVRVQV